MLVIIRSIRELQFTALMDIYEQSNLEAGQQQWPQEHEARQLALAEQDFFDYLKQSFFPTPGAIYCLWKQEHQYVSALRLEPWQDGLLLTGLETAPAHRRKGYALALIRSIQQHLAQQEAVRLYCHINNRNTASIGVHEKCGFRKCSDIAVFIDGSANRNSATYKYEPI